MLEIGVQDHVTTYFEGKNKKQSNKNNNIKTSAKLTLFESPFLFLGKAMIMLLTLLKWKTWCV